MSETRIPRISRGQAQKLQRLLPMEYKPAEIAEEIGVDVRTIYRSYVPAGMPLRKDKQDNIWIIGTEFRDWARAILEKGARSPMAPLAENEVYCLVCKKRVIFQDITRRETWSKGRIRIYARCSECGGKVIKLTKEKTGK
jgi:uncharacterized protein with PIN domain